MRDTETLARPLDNIVALQQALDDLDEARERLQGIPDWMRELHEEHSARKAEVEELDRVAEEAVKERRAAEAAIEDAQQRLKRYQEQLNQVSTQREYGALLQEIDTTREQIRGSEEQGLAALERHDRAQQEVVGRREAFAELDRRYAAELAKWEAEKPAVRQQVEALEARIEELRRGIPAHLLVQFDRLVEKHGGRALAEIRKVDRGGKGPEIWHCGICNYRVRPQIVVELRNAGKLISCDSCKRFLYLGKETA